jgi:hypothetical protein
MSTEREVRQSLIVVDCAITELEQTVWDYLDMAVIGQGATDVDLIHRIEAEAKRLEELADLMRRADPDGRCVEWGVVHTYPY